jgi:hypothetical protein
LSDIAVSECAQAPQVTIVPANDTVTLQGEYTILMADADIVGTNEANGQTRHWLVNGVTLTGALFCALRPGTGASNAALYAQVPTH